MGGDRVANGVVTVLLVGLVLASTPAVTVGLSQGCYDSQGGDLEYAGGDWLVNGGSISVYDSGEEGSWDARVGPRVDERWPTASPDYPALVQIEAFARGPADDWWVVGDDGRVVRFAENWSATGEWYRLEQEPDYLRNEDVAYLDGQWWVLRGDSLVAYNDTWEMVGWHLLDGNHTGLAVVNESLWTVGFEGSVRRFDVRDGEPVEVTSRENAVGRAVRDVEDLHRGPDGEWWVLSRGGGIAQYTTDWEHTGYRRGDTLNLPACGHGSPDASELFVVLYVLVVGGGVVGSVRTHTGAGTGLGRAALGGVSLAVADVLFNYRHPELLSGVYRLPDVAVSTPLVSSTLVVSTAAVLIWDEYTGVDSVLLFAITSPLFFAGLLY